MITLKEILDGSRDKEMAIKGQIAKIVEIMKLISPNSEVYAGWEKRKLELEAMLPKTESLKEAKCQDCGAEANLDEKGMCPECSDADEADEKKEAVKKEKYARTPDEAAQYLYKKKYADLTAEEKKETDIYLADTMQELGESCKKKEAYTIIKVDGAEVPIEIAPEGNEGKDLKGNQYFKLDGKWQMEKIKEQFGPKCPKCGTEMTEKERPTNNDRCPNCGYVKVRGESLKEYNTVMQGSPTEYKIGSRVRIVGGLYSNSYGKITALDSKQVSVELEPTGEKVKVLPAQIALAESFSKKLSLLKEAMKSYDANKEGISKDTEKWIYDMYQKGATADDIKGVLKIQKGIDMPIEGVQYIIQNFKESVVSDYDDKELNDKAMALFGKGFQFLSDAERKQVLDSFKEVIKKEVFCNTCKQDAETVNGRLYCNTCQKYLDESLKEAYKTFDYKNKKVELIKDKDNEFSVKVDGKMLKDGSGNEQDAIEYAKISIDILKESLKEMANINKIKLTGAWNIPKTVSKVQDLAVNYGTHFADGVIDAKGLLDRELNGLMGDLKGMGLTYTTESLKEFAEDDFERQSKQKCLDCGNQFNGNDGDFCPKCKSKNISKMEFLKEFTPKGRNCDQCGASLSDEDFVKAGSWNYTCPKCGFKYREALKESTDKEAEAKKMFGKAYKDLTDEEKKKVDSENMASMLLGEGVVDSASKNVLANQLFNKEYDKCSDEEKKTIDSRV